MNIDWTNPKTIHYIGWGLFLVASVVFVAFALASNFIRRKAEEARIIAMRKAYRAWLPTAGRMQPVQANLAMDDDETAYLAESATMFEPRAIRKSTHTGGVVRVAKNIGVGRGYSTSESHEEWRAVAKGTLCVTSKRVVFDGDMQNRIVKLRDIVSAVVSGADLMLTSSRRAHSMVFRGPNAMIAAEIINRLARTARK